MTKIAWVVLVGWAYFAVHFAVWAARGFAVVGYDGPSHRAALNGVSVMDAHAEPWSAI